MKKRNLQPQQTAPVERPIGGKSTRDPIAMFVAGGGVGASGLGWFMMDKFDPFAGDEAE